MICQWIPKTVFVATNAFQLGVYDAVAHFNIGGKATIKVLKMNPGTLILPCCGRTSRSPSRKEVKLQNWWQKQNTKKGPERWKEKARRKKPWKRGKNLFSRIILDCVWLYLVCNILYVILYLRKLFQNFKLNYFKPLFYWIRDALQCYIQYWCPIDIEFSEFEHCK